MWRDRNRPTTGRSGASADDGNDTRSPERGKERIELVCREEGVEWIELTDRGWVLWFRPTKWIGLNGPRNLAQYK